MRDWIGRLGAGWGVVGVLVLLSSAVVRLLLVGLALVEPTPVQVGAVLGSMVFFGYTEGYRAFQKAFAPRVVRRAVVIREAPNWARVLLAPLFCMGFFDATRRRLIVSWALTAGIVLVIWGVRQLPPVARGIIDLGVVFALLWGMAAIAWFSWQALRGVSPAVDPEVGPRGARPTGATSPVLLSS